jgi:hypothetical protein
MNNLILSHAWLAGLASLAPLYTYSRWLQRRQVAPAGLPPLAAQRRTESAQARRPVLTAARAEVRQHVGRGGAAVPALRVLSVVESGAQTPGRLRISGRMADVCAELDRMVEREARQAGRS